MVTLEYEDGWPVYYADSPDEEFQMDFKPWECSVRLRGMSAEDTAKLVEYVAFSC